LALRSTQVRDLVEVDLKPDLRAHFRAVVAVVVAPDAEGSEALRAELDYAWKWISPGYTRSAGRRRMKTGEPD